jgi:hypothetical protein
MAKTDKRYNTLKKLIIYGGLITTFSEIFDVIPKTVIAKDLGMHHYTLDKLIKNHERLTLKHLYKIASLIKVDRLDIIKLIINESVISKKT